MQKAICYTRYGGPEATSIVDVPKPTPRAGQVLIKTAAGGLNPLDYRVRLGDTRALIPATFPWIAGHELSGTVAALGDGVTTFAVGDEVMVRVGKRKEHTGALAQYVALPARIVARTPKNLPLVEAAGIPLAGLTALQLLDHLGVTAGDRLLITGGAGGVGLFAIQLAKLRGAHVTTTASSAGEVLVRSVGADEVIDYKATKLADIGTQFAKVFDCAGGDMNDLLAATADGGHIATIAGELTPSVLAGFDVSTFKRYLASAVLWYRSRGVVNAAAARGIHYQFYFMLPDGRQLQELSDLVSEGKLRVVVDSTYKFEDYAQAFARLESKRSKGKVVIEFPPA
ncbi:NADP-dependent oxidoreductase domain containing protein [Vanrija pseudolonga]|uniref:Chloroplast envelope quinone oxidoreductase n=1 Tax=Vanrija pseudolonga TaxID=143232 RepID=A0AAF0YFR6_9TREE|nr:Chloroplast envelope quinone oxidoreductase [Vanrija pseudolonga]